MKHSLSWHSRNQTSSPLAGEDKWRAARHKGEGGKIDGRSSTQKNKMLNISSGTGLLLLAGWAILGAGCGTPPKLIRPDPEIERNAALAHGAFISGSANKAAVYYRKALNRARVIDDPAAIGRNAYNLAACLTTIQQYEEARSLLDEADSECCRAGINAREIPLLKARIALRQDHTEEAMALAQSQLRSLATKDPFRIQFQLIVADLLCAKGDVDGAKAELAAINRSCLATAEPSVQADAALIRARLLLLEKKPREAAVVMDTAVGHLQKAGQYVEMAITLDKAGCAYETAGDRMMAIDRYYRAARSLFLNGQIPHAESIINRATLLAEQTGPPEVQQKLKRLQADINAARHAPGREP